VLKSGGTFSCEVVIGSSNKNDFLLAEREKADIRVVFCLCNNGDLVLEIEEAESHVLGTPLIEMDLDIGICFAKIGDH